MLVAEAILNQTIVEFDDYLELRREVSWPESDSRIDFMLASEAGKTYIEVKSVTYLEGGMGYFLDAVTKRGQNNTLKN